MVMILHWIECVVNMTPSVAGALVSPVIKFTTCMPAIVSNIAGEDKKIKTFLAGDTGTRAGM